ncbi:hypothetical protein [Klebsiella pneumoniae]|nr:hypothetical protein [Klebsiella pneumoniae]MBB6667863.1 hypothetical protein [Klebsiella pneumoniae]CEG54768.1 hypothetical protein PXNS11_540008 [Stutzerimonas xanthomarina]VII91537.1 hypothetical protein [Pseudomonas sp. FG-3G]
MSSANDKPISMGKVVSAVAGILFLIGLYWGLSEADLLATLTDEQALGD